MAQFYKEVNTNNRNEMISFLKNHFRYATGNYVMYGTSYANNVKIYNLSLTEEQKENLYDIINCDDDYYCYYISDLIDEFEIEHNNQYKVGFNGRSGGYLVLYDENCWRGIDMYEDFEEWEDDEIKDRVELVQDFDAFCDDMVEQAAWIADNFKVEEETVMIPTTRRSVVMVE